MNTTQAITKTLVKGVGDALSSMKNRVNLEVLLCPPSAYLSLASDIATTYSSPLFIGAQNVSQFEHGAYTGEISLSMLEDCGASYVLLGHSERRQLFLESNNTIAEKFSACVQRGKIKPILCIGETLQERENNITESIIEEQLHAIIDRVGIQGLTQSIIAYEPVWAIGTGKTASPEQAQHIHQLIRDILRKQDEHIANKTLILYGGSMNEKNASALLQQPDIDGGLIGGASLKKDAFISICHTAHQITINKNYTV